MPLSPPKGSAQPLENQDQPTTFDIDGQPITRTPEASKSYTDSIKQYVRNHKGVLALLAAAVAIPMTAKMRNEWHEDRQAQQNCTENPPPNIPKAMATVEVPGTDWLLNITAMGRERVDGKGDNSAKLAFSLIIPDPANHTRQSFALGHFSERDIPGEGKGRKFSCPEINMKFAQAALDRFPQGNQNRQRTIAEIKSGLLGDTAEKLKAAREALAILMRSYEKPTQNVSGDSLTLEYIPR